MLVVYYCLFADFTNARINSVISFPIVMHLLAAPNGGICVVNFDYQSAKRYKLGD